MLASCGFHVTMHKKSLLKHVTDFKKNATAIIGHRMKLNQRFTLYLIGCLSVYG